MKTNAIVLSILASSTFFGACTASVETPADSNDTSQENATAATGNGAPSGPHFNLNIIGVPKDKTMSGGSGNVIFVPEVGSSKIFLSEGDFAVLDKNGTDGQAAFQLPNPDPDGDGITSYSVFARALGKPGGSSTTTTCATDPTTGEVVCSLLSSVLVRTSGKQSFTNVSKQLLFVFADVNGDGVVDRVPLFDGQLTDFFWQYDNNGLKLAQLRFYQVSTNVQ
jgi:hypothetical protein